MKYGFPLFSRPTSLVSLGKNEKLVISDIWAFWDYVIKKASKDRKAEDFLKSLLEQAKHFLRYRRREPSKEPALTLLLLISQLIEDHHQSFWQSRPPKDVHARDDREP
jgi:hypothetical protein